MNEIKYRAASPEDAPTLAELRIQFLTGLLGAQEAGAAENLRAALISYFSSAITTEQYYCVIAEQDNHAVATGGLVTRLQPGSFKNPSGRVGYILSMYTLPDYRRQGICREILNRLIAFGNDKGITAFELHATPDGAPVYEQNGFKKHHEPTYRLYTS